MMHVFEQGNKINLHNVIEIKYSILLFVRLPTNHDIEKGLMQWTQFMMKNLPYHLQYLIHLIWSTFCSLTYHYICSIYKYFDDFTKLMQVSGNFRYSLFWNFTLMFNMCQSKSTYASWQQENQQNTSENK